MVNRHSRGGSLADAGMSSSASAAATPMPLSAPRVVPSACVNYTSSDTAYYILLEPAQENCLGFHVKVLAMMIAECLYLMSSC